MSRLEVRLTGVGGQGIVTAGYLLGVAAVLHEGRQAVLTTTYGPEKRGGWVRADVILSDAPIDDPQVRVPDVLICLAQEGYSLNIGRLASDGLLLYDEDLVRPDPGAPPPLKVKRCGLRAARLADEMGKRVVANLVMLGAFNALTRALEPQALERALRRVTPQSAWALNRKALAAGYQAVSDVKIKDT